VRIVKLHRGRRGIKRDVHALTVVSLVHVALHRERIASVQLPVRSEAPLAHLPLVKRIVINRSLIGRDKLGMKLGGAAERQTINAIIETVSVTSSVTELADTLIDIPAANGRKSAVSVLGALGDDVDDAVDSVCAPDRATGAANYLDSLDVLQQHVLELPIDAGKQRCIDAPAINQHQDGL